LTYFELNPCATTAIQPHRRIQLLSSSFPDYGTAYPAMADATLRNRKPVEVPHSASLGEKSKKRARNDDDEISPFISITDILRVLSGLLVISCVFSWLITDGESLTWGYRPKLSRWRTLKALFVLLPLLPPFSMPMQE
jgi:hypothetical protein